MACLANVTAENDLPRIGCAGWTIPPQFAPRFGNTGTHLQKYAAQFSAVEINSSFYRLHRTETYVRWADSVPADFRFSVKIPKQITHELGLQKAKAATDEFLETVTGLGSKLAVLLVQLPPSLEFKARMAKAFFKHLCEQTASQVVCEPRHATWFSATAWKLLQANRVRLVHADPAVAGGPDVRANDVATSYYRLHGSPRVYYSRYDVEFLHSLVPKLTARPNTWCIFDNTAHGWATQNALELQELVSNNAKSQG